MAEKVTAADTSLEARINAFPGLKVQVETLVRLAEDGLSAIKTGDDAETCVIESGRALQREILQVWAESRMREETATVRSESGEARNKGKKNCGGGRQSARLRY